MVEWIKKIEEILTSISGILTSLAVTAAVTRSFLGWIKGKLNNPRP